MRSREEILAEFDKTPDKSYLSDSLGVWMGSSLEVLLDIREGLEEDRRLRLFGQGLLKEEGDGQT